MNPELPKPQASEDVVTLEYIITKGEFSNSMEFSVYIEREAANRGIGCFEALLEYCEENDIEPVSVSSFITSSLKEKIRAEAEEMNLLKKNKSNKLPL